VECPEFKPQSPQRRKRERERERERRRGKEGRKRGREGGRRKKKEKEREKERKAILGFFFAVLDLELRAFTLSHSTSAIFFFSVMVSQDRVCQCSASIWGFFF
jgi:hypothetical protein